MKQVKMVLFFALIAALVLGAGAALWAQKNLLEDPGFEKTGVTGVARSGLRSGYWEVKSASHFAAMPYIPIKVEPFATYKISGYVKADSSTGGVTALYVYSWNSYDWAFETSTHVANSQDWVYAEGSFVSPDDTAYCHPLVFENTPTGKAWIDDMSVVKTAAPPETIKRLEGKTEKTQLDLQLIIRYHIINNNVEQAESYFSMMNTFTKSDIACFRAKRTRDRMQRTPFILEMIANDGMNYNNANTRLNSMTVDYPVGDKANLVRKIVAVTPGSQSAAKAVARLLDNIVDSVTTSSRLTEKAAFLKQTSDLPRLIRNSYKNNIELANAVEPAIGRIEKMRKESQAALDNKGSRKIYIDGALMTPQNYVIALPDKPTLQEEFVSKDFAGHLENMSGEALAIVPESKVGKKNALYIGKTNLAAKAGVNFDKLGLEGIVIKNSGKNLVLAGNKRGVLYACYTWLENYLGCRWYTPDCSIIPNKGELKLPPIDLTFIPKLEYRATDYPHSTNMDWAVRNKINGNQPNIDEQRGNCIRYQGFVHTFDAMVPPSQYFEQHPEYYSEINGIRIGPMRTQLCLTNPDVLRISIERVRNWFRSNPAATIVSVSQNDWGNYCQCKNCAELAKKEGSQAGPVIHFVNAIADAVKDEFPDKAVDTLAYQWSRKPPLHVKPRPNVIVRLCSIECCFAHPLETCPFNSTFVTDIQNWHKMSNRLWMWDYVINYSHTIMPFPNLYSLKPNINFFINNGVTGIYEEADYYTKGGELAELRTWIMAKTLWDPTYDTDHAIDEFLDAYYGPAAKPIRSYVNLTHKQVLDNPNLHLTIYYPPTSGHLTPEVLKRSNELFDQAENAVRNDEVLLHRVQVARLPIMYSMIALGETGYALRDDKLVIPPNRIDGGLVGAFERIARKEGVTMINEWTTLDNWLASLPIMEQEVPIAKVANNSLELNILPSAGGRIWKMTYIPTGKNLIKLYGQQDSYQITNGGYEEYSGADYRDEGWNEDYNVLEQTPTSIKMQATLKNGLTFTREISLDANLPKINIISTLSNNTSANIEGGIRIHPEFSVVDTNEAFIATKQVQGGWEVTSLSVPDKNAEQEKEMYLSGDDAPAGEWALVDTTDGIGIVNRFDSAMVDFSYYNWFPNTDRVNLELFPKNVAIKPGESITLRHSYEIMPDVVNKLNLKIK